MTVEVDLKESETAALREKAKAMGQEFSEFVQGVLRREAKRPLRSLQQIATDIEKHRGGALDLTEDQIGDMLEVAKHEMRAERRKQEGQ